MGLPDTARVDAMNIDQAGSTWNLLRGGRASLVLQVNVWRRRERELNQQMYTMSCGLTSFP
jgi:hypothetical protein